MSEAIRVGIVGDYDPTFEPHSATDEGLEHAAKRLGVAVDAQWIPSASVLSAEGRARLAQFDALWIAPGSPASLDGSVAGVQFARENDRPLLGN